MYQGHTIRTGLVWLVETGFKLKTFLFPRVFFLCFSLFAFLLYVFKDTSSVDGEAFPVLVKYQARGDKTIVNGCYSVLYVLKVLLCCISVDEAKSPEETW